MHCLVCLNGEYNEISRYVNLEVPELTICADGGSEYALKLGLIPDLVVGDMDSVSVETLERLKVQGVVVKTYPVHKDDTDAQLAFQAALEMGADVITVLGGTGNRLDHTWSAIMSTLPLVRKGVKVRFYKPGEIIYLVTGGTLVLQGEAGQIVSLLALTAAAGVTTEGLMYPLTEAVLSPERPYAISNEFTGNQARIKVGSGILMVVHITG